ncbi:MAG: hypothetical protein HYZ24_19215 [Chloroflexi bacterium]|nr:hypothetical protein [Chloroflexota bacterium]
MKTNIKILSILLILTLSACGSAPATEVIVATSPPVENSMPVPGANPIEMVVAPPQGKIPAPSFESQPYINESLGFILDYPIGWVAQETVLGERGSQVVLASSLDLVEAAPMPEGGSRVTATTYVWDPQNDLAAYVEHWKGVWTSSGFAILDEEPTILDLGLAAVRITVQTPEATMPYLITALNGKYLVLTGEGDVALVTEIISRLRPTNQ